VEFHDVDNTETTTLLLNELRRNGARSRVERSDSLTSTSGWRSRTKDMRTTGLRRRWFATLKPDMSLAFCRLTHLGLLRLLTTDAVMGDEVMTQHSPLSGG
jgi:hypothetical protein